MLLSHWDSTSTYIPHPEREDKNGVWHVQHSCALNTLDLTNVVLVNWLVWYCGRLTESRPFNHLACGSAQTILGTQLVLSHFTLWNPQWERWSVTSDCVGLVGRSDQMEKRGQLIWIVRRSAADLDWIWIWRGFDLMPHSHVVGCNNFNFQFRAPHLNLDLKSTTFGGTPRSQVLGQWWSWWL